MIIYAYLVVGTHFQKKSIYDICLAVKSIFWLRYWLGSASPASLPLAIKYRLLDISPFDFPAFSSENNNLFPKDQNGLQLLLTTCPLPGNETQGPLLQKPKQNTFSPLEQIYRWQPQIKQVWVLVLVGSTDAFKKSKIQVDSRQWYWRNIQFWSWLSGKSCNTWVAEFVRYRGGAIRLEIPEC